MIRFPCSGCDKVMNAADENAGKKARCPSCSEIVVIPRKSILPDPAKPSAGAAGRKPQRPAEDNGDDGETNVARKPLPAAAKAKPKPPPPDEDEDDIPEVEAADEDDDDFEEEEEEERPKKKSKKKSKKRKLERSGPYVSCPNCGAGGAFKVYYSFWFGFTPAFICHVQCPRCGNQYNGNSGNSNTGTLILIQVVITVVVVGVAIVFGVLGAIAENMH